MFIVSVCAFGAVLAILLHLVALPLAKRRPVLLLGAESYALGALAIVAVGFLHPWALPALVLLGVQLIVATVWRPWLVMGVSAEQVGAAVVKASKMVRIRRQPLDERSSAIGEKSRLSVGSVLPSVQVVTLRLRPSTPLSVKKIALFRNVLRKTIQNYSLGRS